MLLRRDAGLSALIILVLALGIGRTNVVVLSDSFWRTRSRLIRQFLLEGFVLAICGVVGLILSQWLTQILVGLLPMRSPLFESARPDARVIALTMALSLISALLFAIIPAVKGSAWTLGPSISARAAAGQGNRWRHAMIAIEAALSVFLLCGAGLIGQNLLNLVSTSVGFDPQNVTVMQIRMPYRREQALNPNPSRGYQEYLERIAAVPGVESAAAVTGLPLRGASSTSPACSRFYPTRSPNRAFRRI